MTGPQDVPWRQGPRTVGVFFLFLILAAPARAQVNILIEYIKVPPEAVERYHKAQQEQMKPYHQGLLEEKKIYAWYDYQVRFPQGTSAAYTHVVVTVMADSSLIPTRTQHLPYADYIAHTEIYRPVYDLRSPGYETMASAYSSINFWYAEPAHMQAVRAYMQQEMKPKFDALVASDQWMTWSAFHRVWPAESEQPYNHVLVTRHRDFSKAEVAVPFIPEKQGKWGPTLIKADLWKLRQIVM